VSNVTSQLNLANIITIIRILLVPVFLVVLLSGLPEPYADIGAAIVFAVAAASDKLDGYIARKQHSITALGQFLDPLADKLLIAAALIALVAQGRVPAWVAMVIIGREIAVTVLRSVGQSQGISIPADRWGKLKTVLQIVYIMYVLLPTVAIAELLHLPVSWEPIVQWILAILVVVVTLVSGVNYFRNARGLVRMPGSPPK
jgi:CDP-diacylglycerol--glycerol-3-phosphate 3-phosphatidyltransferase